MKVIRINELGYQQEALERLSELMGASAMDPTQKVNDLWEIFHLA